MTITIQSKNPKVARAAEVFKDYDYFLYARMRGWLELQDGLMVKITKGANSISRVQIRVNDDNTVNLRFLKVNGKTTTEVAEYENENPNDTERMVYLFKLCTNHNDRLITRAF